MLNWHFPVSFIDRPAIIIATKAHREKDGLITAVMEDDPPLHHRTINVCLLGRLKVAGCPETIRRWRTPCE